MDSWSSGPAMPEPQGEPAAPGISRPQPLTLGDVLDGMFRLVISHWRVYLIALGVVLIPYNLASGWLSAEAMGGMTMWSALMDPTFTEGAMTGAPASPMPGVGMALLSLVAYLFVNPVTLGLASRIAAEAYEGGDPAPGDVWRSTMNRYPALLGVVVMLTLVLIGVVVVPVIVLTLAIAAESPLLAVVIVIAMLVAMAWLFVKFSLAFAVVVVERTGPLKALGRSWDLVRERFWKVFGTLLLAGIIVGVISMLIVFVFGLPGLALGQTASVVLGVIAGVVASLVTTPLVANAATLLYYDGRIRREGYDLDVMAQQVEGGAVPPEQPLG